MFPRPTIEAFDAHLVAIGLRLEAIFLGGSALALLGVTTRQTRDFDIIAPELSKAILEAARVFARDQRAHPDWPKHVADTLDDLSRRLGHGV